MDCCCCWYGEKAPGLLGEACTAVEGLGLLDLVGEAADVAEGLLEGDAASDSASRPAVAADGELVRGGACCACLLPPRPAFLRAALALPPADAIGAAPTELDSGAAAAGGAADRWYTDMLGCSMSRFSSGDVSSGTEPEVKQGGGVTNHDSSSGPQGGRAAAPAASSLSGQW